MSREELAAMLTVAAYVLLLICCTGLYEIETRVRPGAIKSGRSLTVLTLAHMLTFSMLSMLMLCFVLCC